MQLDAIPNKARGLNTSAAAHYIGFSEGFLRKARRGKTQVKGPKYRRIGNRVVYCLEDLDAFLDEFPAESSIKDAEKQPLANRQANSDNSIPDTKTEASDFLRSVAENSSRTTGGKLQQLGDNPFIRELKTKLCQLGLPDSAVPRTERRRSND